MFKKENVQSTKCTAIIESKNYSLEAFNSITEQNSFVLKLLRNYIYVTVLINRTGVTSKEYVLPIAEDKAGSYACKVTVGSAESSYSASSTIATTGLSLGIFYLMICNYRFGSLKLFEFNRT